MKGYQATFVGLFDAPEAGRPAITSIEIPIIQRDFAQGRPDDEATPIRERFIDAIVRAATGDAGMGLDFIYGDVKGGVLRPLDGQQRLTTLFLLHWYVASLAGELDPAVPWLRFSYATRPTARDFCAALAEHPYPGGSARPSAWITDQPWYVYPWRQDPTISSMLVMLDAIHERFDHEQTDFSAVWDRLSDRQERTIWFLFLPVADMDYGEDLYIKMNSRGKPLTAFEVFKADLESALAPVLSYERHEHLKASIDGTWADLLWEYEKTGSGDFVIDDEFMRYLRFIIDVCEWRDGAPDRRWRDAEGTREWPLEERARLAFAGPNKQHSARNRDFFFHAFDTWTAVSPAAEFAKLFVAGKPAVTAPGKPTILSAVLRDEAQEVVANWGAKVPGLHRVGGCETSLPLTNIKDREWLEAAFAANQALEAAGAARTAFFCQKCVTRQTVMAAHPATTKQAGPSSAHASMDAMKTAIIAGEAAGAARVEGENLEADAAERPLPLLVSTSPDLFGACIAKYGVEREFSLAETLMLFAVLLARQMDPPPSQAALNRRLRSLRNLAESAFIDRKRMVEYVGTTERLVVSGTLQAAQGFNAEWTADEQLKWEFTDAHPEAGDSLDRLEDLMVLRGRLLAFELDADIEVRASAFAAIADPSLRDAFGAALLTKGDYSRDVGWNGERRQLGSSAKDDSWRDLFTTGSRASVTRTRVPLMALLDDVHGRLATGESRPVEVLEAIRHEWLIERERREQFDWRYYLVRYRGARSSMGEGYFHNAGYDDDRRGFSYGGIKMLFGANYTAHYADALLRAAWIEGDLRAIAHEPRWWRTYDRGMGMQRSAVEIRCVNTGFELVLPEDDAATSATALQVIQRLPHGGEKWVRVQQARDGIDSEDRVQVCIRLVQALHAAGL